MPAIGNTYVDLIDIYKRQDPDGSIADVIEMLMELNPMLQDAYAVECNNGTTHRHSIRTGLPSVAWGKLYQGIAQSKSTFAQVDDATGFVEGLSTVDKRVLDLSGNQAAVRLSEARGFLEAIAQEVQETLIYGNSNSAPEEFMGFAPRFNDTTAANGNQIISAGGAGADNTSIWMVTWADHAAHLLYPKGTKAGVTREDKGEQRVLDGSSNAYYVMEELFCQNVGLAVKDWRYVTRVANIDLSAMQADPTNIDGSNNSLYHFLRKAYYAHQGRRTKHASGKAGFPGGGRTVVYCNSDVLEALDALSANAGSNDVFSRLRPMEIQGQEVLTYRGMAIRETDAIHNAEAVVS
jgi:hypothetical protein